jgi:hypothetical protein
MMRKNRWEDLSFFSSRESFGQKLCSSCHEWKKSSDFAVNGSDNSDLCWDCQIKKNIERANKIRRIDIEPHLSGKQDLEWRDNRSKYDYLNQVPRDQTVNINITNIFINADSVSIGKEPLSETVNWNKRQYDKYQELKPTEWSLQEGKECNVYRISKPLSEFRKSWQGRSNACKSCLLKSRLEKYPPSECLAQKQCLDCGQFKSISDFPDTITGEPKICKACLRKYR